MYWFREQNILSFFSWIFCMLAWWLGGSLISAHNFNLEKKHWLFAGFGLGLVLYLWLANIIGHWLPPTYAYTLPSIIILMVGLLLTKKELKQLIDKAILDSWPILVIWAGIFCYSLLLERGLMIFDEQLQLPAISVIANSYLPPRYFLNAETPFVYHYGFQLLGASLMKIGGMFVWSASDFAKALVWSFSLIMAGLVANQYIKNTWKTVAGIAVFTFLGNTRYLLMLLPVNILQTFDKSIGFLGVSSSMKATFSQSLFMPWNVIPGPPRPFIFGFVSGIYLPYHMHHTGQFPFAILIIFLIWFLSSRAKSWKAVPFMSIVWAQLALTYESAYALLAASLVVIFIYQYIIKKDRSVELLNFTLIALMISIPIALFQGGALISIVQNVMQKFGGGQSLVSVHNKVDQIFSFNWPPTIFSSNFGDLNLFNPAQLIVGLFEIGPIVFLLPFIVKWCLRKYKSGDWIVGFIILSTLFGFLAYIFLRYNPSRDAITRFSEFVMAVWYFFLIILIFEPNNGLKRLPVVFSIICTFLISISGLCNFLVQLSAIPNPVLSDHITGLDSRISSQVWGTLPENEIIFDPNALPGRASEVTGLPTVFWQYRQVLPFWKELYDHPSLEGILENHFRYVYIDERWWLGLTESEKKSLSNPCIQVVAEITVEKEFRRLLDLAQCNLAS